MAWGEARLQGDASCCKMGAHGSPRHGGHEQESVVGWRMERRRMWLEFQGVGDTEGWAESREGQGWTWVTPEAVGSHQGSQM